MKLTAIFINILAMAGVLVTLLVDIKKAKQSLLVAVKSFFRIFPTFIIILLIISILLGFIPKIIIARIIGQQSGIGGILLVSLIGAILHMSAIISFPLAASLIESGASITAVAAFITTLTMVGIVTLPLEIKEMGAKITILRNSISFIIAIAIALIIGLIL